MMISGHAYFIQISGMILLFKTTFKRIYKFNLGKQREKKVFFKQKRFCNPKGLFSIS